MLCMVMWYMALPIIAAHKDEKIRITADVIIRGAAIAFVSQSVTEKLLKRQQKK